METMNLNIQMDKEIKEQSEHIFSELGMSMTTAINLFLRAAIRERGIPFGKKIFCIQQKHSSGILSKPRLN